MFSTNQFFSGVTIPDPESMVGAPFRCVPLELSTNQQSIGNVVKEKLANTTTFFSLFFLQEPLEMKFPTISYPALALMKVSKVSEAEAHKVLYLKQRAQEARSYSLSSTLRLNKCSLLCLFMVDGLRFGH